MSDSVPAAAPVDPVSAARAVLDREDLRVRVQKTLDDVLSRQAATVEAVSPHAAPLVEYVTDLLRGGKRLRPAFAYWGWRGAGGPDCQEVVAAATSLELFQAAALVHDDVMDDSDTRRGLPAVHRRFARLHRGAGWHGDTGRFGTAGAILAGDLCLSWSDELLTASGLPTDALARGRVVFDRMRTELMAGQYLDMLEQVTAGETDPTGEVDPVESARNVIRFKSAKYSIEHPLLLGGTLAGAPQTLLDAYSAYGLPLGEAFQLRDDLLGVFGDPAETGKPAGDDLREGKRTVLVALALERATPAQAGQVRRLLGDPGLGPDGVEVLREVLLDTGAADRVEAMIVEDVEAARAALARADVDDDAREVLEGLVVAATARST
ncbi:polyprenyl synthetase family protein [Aquipuribacter nitratireducens]|uniref:Polyprenyl synthetase family protein n=1 Tax=Aquipuribacter nitratireducens TaxID=650104 RepID=A0ABW0GVQ7_9MICO